MSTTPSSAGQSTQTPREAARERLCYPLDFPTLRAAIHGAEEVVEHVGVFKIGLELFIQSGPEAVRAIQRLGRRIFLDLKLHDIPKTVERAVLRAAELEVNYLTVHASGGMKMLRPAAEQLLMSGSQLRLLGVTVLTSHSQEDAEQVGWSGSLSEQALRLARVGQSAGLHGLVCSTHELGPFRREFGQGLELVTPGIRPAGAAPDDQSRVGTPAAAIQAGASMLVVGRPIQNAADPAASAAAIAREIAENLA